MPTTTMFDDFDTTIQSDEFRAEYEAWLATLPEMWEEE